MNLRDAQAVRQRLHFTFVIIDSKTMCNFSVKNMGKSMNCQKKFKRNNNIKRKLIKYTVFFTFTSSLRVSTTSFSLLEQENEISSKDLKIKIDVHQNFLYIFVHIYFIRIRPINTKHIPIVTKKLSKLS